MKTRTPLHRKRRHPSRRDLKDRLIQTRVPESLESKLKKEAGRRRLSVSHLIRNVLEDTFDLVDGVVADVDTIVQDSLGLAGRVGRDAGRIADRAVGNVREGRARKSHAGESEADEAYGEDGDEGEELATEKTSTREAENRRARGQRPSRPGGEPDLDHILAWNAVVMNRDGECARCGVALPRGGPGHLGISQDPTAAPTWLCGECVSKL